MNYHNEEMTRDDFDSLAGLLIQKNRALMKIIDNNQDAKYYKKIIDIIDSYIYEIIGIEEENINKLVDAILELLVKIQKEDETMQNDDK
ncbi:hypothetical protein EDC21_1256 [Thermohydrogenium kirishiense]|uniref:hypothetical protein n=1 Tax=Thermoanaerobacterium TaxID=28895 RepID=UPI0010442BA7|nr:hypothetical protein [Thermoanaerobacterium sp. CMT5567-10]TCW32620.1 hypothetical protein EDC21_1256 [Thermohydrogenium kirishiense]WKV07559.1 hypothetical protein Q2T46_08160 [Thermoanaerobacterium sp. CMT5567-10]